MRGFSELDRPQILEQHERGGGVVIHHLSDHLDVFYLDDAADFQLQRIEDVHHLRIKLLHLKRLVFPVGILADNDQVNHPHDLALHQLEQRGKYLAFELVALKLKGQVEIENLARIDSVKGGLRATFFTVPDVPFSTIELNLVGGKKGLLQNTESLCASPQRAKLRMIGQNGATMKSKSKLKVSCGKSKKRRARLGSSDSWP